MLSWQKWIDEAASAVRIIRRPSLEIASPLVISPQNVQNAIPSSDLVVRSVFRSRMMRIPLLEVITRLLVVMGVAVAAGAVVEVAVVVVVAAEVVVVEVVIGAARPSGQARPGVPP